MTVTQTQKDRFVLVRSTYYNFLKSLKAADALISDLQKEYLKKAGFNCTVIEDIEDDELFEFHSKQFEEEAKSEIALLKKISEQLYRVENVLIERGICLVQLPKGEKRILEESAKSNYTIRRKIINLILRLDVNTIPLKGE